MNRLEEMKKFAECWVTSLGGSTPGEGVVFRGEDMFKKFKGWNWLSMFYYCITDKKPSKEAEIFLNSLFCMCFNYPDPRIWNNRVAALAGSVRSTAQLGVCAGSAVSEAEFYGGSAGMRAMDFLYRAKELLDDGESLKTIVKREFKENRAVFGYGRPININDERVAPALELLDELGLKQRDYVQLCLKVDEELNNSRYKFKLNIGGLLAAFCADEGMGKEDIYYLGVVCFSVGMLACYLDALQKPEGFLFPLICDQINYAGESQRTWT